MTNKEIWEKFLEKIKIFLKTFYQENLLAAVIFGSAARGDFNKSSDLDILIILKESPDSLGKRIDKFMQLFTDIRNTDEYLKAKEEGLPHKLEPVILSKEEFQSHPPLLLDLTTDALPLIDEENFFSREIDILRQRLKELGAKKVILDNGRWYWILKPDIKWGEEVTI
ncbi:MAG: nucleotidyltransferase domain-containing protein [Thermodesulfobacteriota bacterium]